MRRNPRVAGAVHPHQVPRRVILETDDDVARAANLGETPAGVVGLADTIRAADSLIGAEYQRLAGWPCVSGGIVAPREYDRAARLLNPHLGALADETLLDRQSPAGSQNAAFLSRRVDPHDLEIQWAGTDKEVRLTDSNHAGSRVDGLRGARLSNRACYGQDQRDDNRKPSDEDTYWKGRDDRLSDHDKLQGLGDGREWKCAVIIAQPLPGRPDEGPPTQGDLG